MEDVDLTKILELYPEYDKIRGPHQIIRKKSFRNDVDRLYLTLISSKNPRKPKLISYPKVLMEIHLGYRIKADEVVHHIDHNYTNNLITNLQVLKKDEHNKLHTKK